MKPYADTNLFTRLYLELPESHAADALVASVRAGGAAAMPVTWLHRIELVNALELHVFVGRQPGHIRVTPEQAAAAMAQFREDTRHGEFLAELALAPSAIEARAEQLALRHTARRGFRTYDLLHVASALALDCDAFWSFDPRASKLARLEGLQTANP